jgi:hypothetical protein
MPYVLPSWVSETCIMTGWITAVLFAILYTLKAPWWETQMGRNILGFDIGVAMALTPGFLQDAFGMDSDTEFFQWLVVGDLVIISALIVHRGYLLLKVQRDWNSWVIALATGVRGLYVRLRRKQESPPPPPPPVPVDVAGGGKLS